MTNYWNLSYTDKYFSENFILRRVVPSWPISSTRKEVLETLNITCWVYHVWISHIWVWHIHVTS